MTGFIISIINTRGIICVRAVTFFVREAPGANYCVSSRTPIYYSANLRNVFLLSPNSLLDLHFCLF